MNDITVTRQAKIIEKALDGLSARQKALAANVANVQSTDYTRSDVVFEDQLQYIINQENLGEKTRIENSRMPLSVNYNMQLASLPNITADYNNFLPENFIDTESPVIANNNNVNIEYELAQLSKNASRYQVLSQLQAKQFSQMLEQIKSAGTLS